MSQLFVPSNVETALADPETARATSESAVLLIGGAPPRVQWANQAALALFQAVDCDATNARALAGSDPGAKRFRQLAALLAAGAPARVENLRFRLEGAFESLAWRVRRLGPPADLLVAILERPKPMSAQDAIESPAPPPDAAASQVTAAATAAATATGSSKFREDLARRFGDAEVSRFLWRADKDNRIVEVSAAFHQALGCAPDALIGQDFAQLAERLRIDPDRRLRAALADRKTWAKIRVLWPAAGAALALPVTLGAAPVLAADGSFDGWRGFGVIDLLAPTERLLDPSPVRETDEEPKLEAAADEPAAAAIEPPLPFRANVVALRRLQLVRPSPAAGAPVRETTAEDAAAPEAATPAPAEQAPTDDENDGGRGALTRNERLAFHEIARALGARSPLYESGLSAPSPDLAGAADPLTPEPESGQTAAPEDAAAGLRAALGPSPFGALVSRGGDILWLNGALAALLGHADAEQAKLSDGLRELAGQAAHMAPQTDLAPLTATDRAGDAVALEGASHAADWLGQPATMTLVRRADQPESSRVKFLEAELRRRDAEARELHSILDTATDGVAVLDEENRLISLNRAGEALFGCDQNQVAGAPFASLLAPESHAAALEYFKQVASNGVGSLLNDGREIVGRARRGGAIPIFMTLGRVNAGGAVKFCAVLRDLTAWKKVERELNEARSVAERASALKSDFLAKVSHEVRTPLNAILGFAEVIMDERFGPVGNERYRDYLKDIHASGTHVMSLVNDLLDLSKIEAGKMELTFDHVDANKIVAECVSIMQPQANSERVIVRLSTAPGLPIVVADERSLRQIVLNLLSNAVKFNEPGGQVIVSTALTDAGHVVIRIRDTGIGMSESELVTALEPFRQVQTSRQTSGTGLGLPLTKALVEANCASFTVKSKKAEGTLVEVAFPPARVMAE